MKTFEEFKAHFKENVHEKLEGLEQRRLQMHNRRLQTGGLVGILIFFHWIGVITGVFYAYTLIVTVVIFPIAGVFFFRRHFIDHTIANDYKEAVVKEMVAFLDPSLSYDANGHISYEDFDKSQLIRHRPDFFGGDDLISGMIDGIPVSISELNIKYRLTDKKRNKEKWATLFLGVFLMAEHPKGFLGRTLILPDPLVKNLGYAGELVQRNNLLKGQDSILQYVRSANDKFRDNFAVYADKLAEGEMLLSKALVERIMLLKKRSKSDIYVSFVGKHIFLGVDLRREIFKVDTTRPLYNPNFVKNFYHEMLYIFSIVEDLDIGKILATEEPQSNAAGKEEAPSFEED